MKTSQQHREWDSPFHSWRIADCHSLSVLEISQPVGTLPAVIERITGLRQRGSLAPRAEVFRPSVSRKACGKSDSCPKVRRGFPRPQQSDLQKQPPSRLFGPSKGGGR